MSASGQTTVTGYQFVAKAPEAFTYDSDGNLASDGRWNYGWDAENRLIAMTNNNASVGPQQVLHFEYDWRSRRIHKQVWGNNSGNGTATNDLRFAYDGWNLIAELSNIYSPIRSYMWGLDLSGSHHGTGGAEGLVELVSYGPTGGAAFVGCQGNGNVPILCDAAAGSVSARYEYGPFGEFFRSTGPTSALNPLRLSTKYGDDESDLTYYGHRYLNPYVGRWLSRDSISERGGMNLYAFVQNRPQMETDNLGHASWDYSVSAPNGLWVVRLEDFVHPRYGTLHGFRAQYSGSISPPCPCKKENIILAQAVRTYGLYADLKLDNVPAVFKKYHHKNGTPLRDYYELEPDWVLKLRGNDLAIIDTPLFNGTQNNNYTWSFEDCAICRHVLKNGDTIDRVLGCITFNFVRHANGTADLDSGASLIIALAANPTERWNKALADWKSWTDN